MNRHARQVLEVSSMVAVSALLYVEFFHLNGIVFSNFERIPGVNWVFLPAGFRVLLVLGMGLPGAAGILLGNCWLDRALFNDDTLWMLLATALVSGFSPWFVKRVMEKKQLLSTHLRKFSAAHLLKFVLACALLNAFAHHFVWWAFKKPGASTWGDLWPMFVGDAVGALVVLYVLKLMLPTLFAWAGPLRPKSRSKTKPASR
jgi:hypothetical protein